MIFDDTDNEDYGTWPTTKEIMPQQHLGWTYRTYNIKEEDFPRLKVVPVLLRSFKNDSRVQFPTKEGWVELNSCKLPFTLLDWIEDQKGTEESAHTRGKITMGYTDKTNFKTWGVEINDVIMVVLKDTPVFITPSHGKLYTDKVEFPYD
jgi:hypothetical protein